MAFLGKGKKHDLIILAEELGEIIPLDCKMVDLKRLILQSKDYDEEFVKEFLSTIIKDRKKREDDELEREKALRELALEREKAQREFELEKRRIELAERSHVESEEGTQNNRIRIDLHKLMQKFDKESGDISLYLILFERQARRAEIDENNWVHHLLGLLPYDITQLIAREPEDKAEDYEHVKNLLLKRFKLSPEKFRQIFVKHQKDPNHTWRDFVYELRNYFEEWVKGLEVSTFDKLVDLMVADQVKRRTPADVREHFIDEWSMITSSTELADKLDEYESVRENMKKKTTAVTQKEQNISKWKNNSNPKVVNGRNGNAYGFFDRNLRGTDNGSRFPKNNFQFDKRKNLQCFECGSYDHLRPLCPKLKKRQDSNFSTLNRIMEMTEDVLSPYTTMGKVNGFQMPILRDTGACIDIICQKYITPEMLTGETVWVKQPLDVALTCLPIAEIELDCNSGHVVTKAAVVRNELDQGRYLLGNRTAEMMKKMKLDEYPLPYQLNAVQTRAQKLLQNQKVFEEKPAKEIEVSDTPASVEVDIIDDRSLLPDAEIEKDEGLSLLKVSSENFAEAQKRSEDLKPLFELAAKSTPADQISECYILKNNLLVKRKTDKTGTKRYLLLVPEEYRERLKTLCHEGTSAHLGVTKSKDALAKHFYWPNCFKELENFIRTCDHCQRAGKPNDKKKAPMKLVPIIQEVFSKINVDACGPLPTTPNGKRYIITAMCLSSKYPDAVAVTDIKSVTVVDALLQIFSRMGFPKEIQCDQGTSFMSELTTEFLKRFGIKVTNSSVYHPQSNPVERFHRTIKRILRVLCLESGQDWEQNIHSALFALRTVTHESTGFTPAELIHGKNLRTPLTLLYENWMEPAEEGNSVVEYVFELINRLKRCQEVAVQKMGEVQSKRKTWYDKNAVKREFKEGDLVLVLTVARPNKLAVQWAGPGTILSKISETNYIVSIAGKKEKSQIYHVNMLKPYYKRPEMINYLSCCETDEQPNEEIDLPSLEFDPNIFDFSIIMEESRLKDRLECDQIQELQNLLWKYSKSFSNEPGLTTLVEHDIELTSDQQIRAKPYRMSQRQSEILKTEIQKMLNLKIIEIGESDYTSPMILVDSPGKDPRPCIDYRKLNSIMRTQFYPLPNIEERVETVSSARYITILDLAKGFWQIPLTPNAQRLASFVTSFGTYRPLRMPFGLKNAPFFFSKMMAKLLQGCEEFAVPYLDDVAIFSSTWKDRVKSHSKSRP